MPIWAYHLSSSSLALVIVIFLELVSITGLLLTRKFLIPRLRFHDGVSDAISGTVQAIGVFYGITVGLLAVGVWNTHANSSDLVSKEASAIGVLYRNASGYPEPLRTQVRSKIRELTVATIDRDWPAQKSGQKVLVGPPLLDSIQGALHQFEPTTPGMSALHSETLEAFNNFIEVRRRRVEAVDCSLSEPMWAVIWIGAAISISVAYLYKIEDVKIHIMLVALMAGFLGILLFMIVINDRPFLGNASISPDPYKLIMERVIDR